MGKSWKTPCLSVEAEKPSEEKMSVYSQQEFAGFLWIHMYRILKNSFGKLKMLFQHLVI